MAKDTQPVEIVAGSATIGTVSLTGRKTELTHVKNTTVTAGSTVIITTDVNVEPYPEIVAYCVTDVSHAFDMILQKRGASQTVGMSLYASTVTVTVAAGTGAVSGLEVAETPRIRGVITNNSASSRVYDFYMGGIK